MLVHCWSVGCPVTWFGPLISNSSTTRVLLTEPRLSIPVTHPAVPAYACLAYTACRMPSRLAVQQQTLPLPATNSVCFFFLCTHTVDSVRFWLIQTTLYAFRKNIYIHIHYIIHSLLNMLLTSPSFIFVSSALLSAVQAQPHGHIRQHATSKRASTGVVSGRGIVYPYGATGMEALNGKVNWHTDWSGWADAQGANLGDFAPQVWGLDDPANDCKFLFICASIKCF